MKKIICTVIALLMLLSLAACADPQTDTPPQDSGTGDSPAAAPGTNGETGRATEADTGSGTSSVFDMDKAIAYIDGMTAGDYFLSLKNLLHETNKDYNTKITKVGDKITVDEGGFGNGVWLDDGCYHWYTYGNGKWQYFGSYHMSAAVRYDYIVNARYWWKKELTLLGFTDFAGLKYKADGTVEDVDGNAVRCALYECQQTLNEYGPVTVTLWVEPGTGNVLQLQYCLGSDHPVKTMTLRYFYIDNEGKNEIKFRGEPLYEYMEEFEDDPNLGRLTRPILN